ncbi:MAG: winged helix-turn-helix transcriptional regulator [Balneolaceae bacterium]|nr:winged helix-turn-helix transcriptional regulator [Balneolaceae bacterium]MBO6547942.1 winged helix-turn-helix transcriptional regulator [Balneolaceae bacterium]MBO6648455.1 winged helix-turn-helix transcriptional regulator [Balneolaceae bacterium]
MGKSKSSAFTEVQNRLAATAKALAHPARIAILQHLAKKNSCVCGDIVNEIPLSQSTVSQHLKELKAAGLIKGEVEGVSVCYCIDELGWQSLTDQLSVFINKPDSKSCC